MNQLSQGGTMCIWDLKTSVTTSKGPPSHRTLTVFATACYTCFCTDLLNPRPDALSWGPSTESTDPYQILNAYLGKCKPEPSPASQNCSQKLHTVQL